MTRAELEKERLLSDLILKRSAYVLALTRYSLTLSDAELQAQGDIEERELTSLFRNFDSEGKLS